MEVFKPVYMIHSNKVMENKVSVPYRLAVSMFIYILNYLFLLILQFLHNQTNGKAVINCHITTQKKYNLNHRKIASKIKTTTDTEM